MKTSLSVALLFVSLVLSAGLGGCLVEGRCLGDGDCDAGERCLSGACAACRTAAECAALVDKNPSSPSFGQSIELIAFRDDVVLLYLANAT